MKKSISALTLLVAVGLLLPGCTPAPPDCALPEVFCVGLVTQAGTGEVQAFNEAARAGLQETQDTGLSDWTAVIQTIEAQDYAVNIRFFVEQGYDVIVTVGALLDEATAAAAVQYPQVYFIGVDQIQPEDREVPPNLAALVFPEEQAGYLAGALAALMTQTGQVGAVLASDTLQLYGEGFRIGALSTDPEVEVQVIFNDEVDPEKAFDDPEWGATVANSLVDRGVDVIFGAGGTTASGVLTAGASRGVYVIGAEVDQYLSQPVAAPRLLASAMKLIGPGVVDLIELAKAALAQAGSYPSGNFEGQVGLSPYHDLGSAVPEAARARLDQLTQDLRSGSIQIRIP